MQSQGSASPSSACCGGGSSDLTAQLLPWPLGSRTLTPNKPFATHSLRTLGLMTVKPYIL
jgi:hypothetical protein